MSTSFVVLVPVKGSSTGKSRLAGLGDDLRRSLTEAFARDTVSACMVARAVVEVVVVTRDPEQARWAKDGGCRVQRDGAADLNEALRIAADESRDRWPGAVPIAVCSDLPALNGGTAEVLLEEVAGALSAPDAPSAVFVADAGGLGTTVYAARRPWFAPLFGPSSAARHRAAGAREVGTALARARRDVDTPGDLEQARALGVGVHTTAALT